MNAQEFSDQFDIEWNNIMSNQAPNLDVYEKSRFLTQAQEQVVIQIYDGKLSDGFESKELYRRYLANLIKRDNESFSSHTKSTLYPTLYEYNVDVKDELLVFISEKALWHDECGNTDRLINVVPTKYDEINISVDNPFRRPNYHRALRLDEATHKVSILSDKELSSYTYEYLKKPYPIILEDLRNYSVEVDGQKLPLSNTEVCELDSSLHRTIISQAAQLAAIAWADKK